MDLRLIARWAGLAGGLLWLARFVLDLAGQDGALLDVLHWVGLVLLASWLVSTGAGLVSRSATWLRAIVAVALPLLVWSVLEVLHPAGDPVAIDGVVGLVVAALAAYALLTRRPERPEKPQKPEKSEKPEKARRAEPKRSQSTRRAPGARSSGSHAR